MANYSKFIKLLLSFVIAISPIFLINNANAASLGGWTLGGGVAKGASTVYNGTKNLILNGKNVVQKGVATIIPNAPNVAKVLKAGIAGYALGVAVEQLLGSVDWVLDPANNQIRYTVPSVAQPVDPADPSNQYIYVLSYGATKEMSSVDQVCKEGQYRQNSAKPQSDYEKCVLFADQIMLVSSWWQVGYRIANPAYDPQAPSKEDEQKSIPLDVVAQKVISNAESGDVSAQEATTAAAADIVSDAEKDNVKARPIVNQLESSAETATDETATGETTTKDPTTGETTKTDINLAFPVFCGWAPTVCQAASVVISFPTLVTEWWQTANTKADGWVTSISESWAAAKEWATSESSQDNTQVDVENNNTQEIDTQVSFSTQCPAPINLANFSYHGISQSWTVDFSKFCDVFATYLRPVVISIGAFSAVLIVSGVGVRENG